MVRVVLTGAIDSVVLSREASSPRRQSSLRLLLKTLRQLITLFNYVGNMGDKLFLNLM